jgi:hypothetical protein
MQHQAVDSGMLASVGYDPSTLTLEVKFKRGETYAYDGVPADVHEAFINADSVGSFFSKAIKSSFPSRKVSADGTSTPVVAPAPKAVATPEPTPQPGPLVLVATSVIPALEEEKLKTELNLIKVESKELVTDLENTFNPLLLLLDEAKIAPLLELRVQTEQDYVQVAEIGKVVAAFRKNVERFFKPIKQQTDEPHDKACEIERRFVAFAAKVESHLKVEVTRFRIAQEEKRRTEAAAIEAQNKKTVEDTRLDQAIKAEASGNTGLAEKLIAAPIYAKKATEADLTTAAAPKVEGMKKRKLWKYEVTDANAVPREYLCVDLVKVGSFVRGQQDKAIDAIPGIRVWSEDVTDF